MQISVSDTLSEEGSLREVNPAGTGVGDCQLQAVESQKPAGKVEQTYVCDCFSQCTKCSAGLKDSLNNNNVLVSSTHSANTLSVTRANTRHKLRQQSSSQGSFDGSSSTSPCLSRGNCHSYLNLSVLR